MRPAAPQEFFAATLNEQEMTDQDTGVTDRIALINPKETSRAEMLALWEGVPEEVNAYFTKKYGKINSLFTIRGQKCAIFSLFKYWNPRLGVFTFADMDLTPTLEEYAALLGMPLQPTSAIYAQTTVTNAVGRLTQLLETAPTTVAKNLGQRNNIQGWTVQFIMAYLVEARRLQKWEKFCALSALVIYGSLLFPTCPDRIDILAVEIFGEVHFHHINPVTAILAETIRGLTLCKTGQIKVFRGSWILLYVWISFHVIHDQSGKFHIREPQPLAHFENLGVPEQSAGQWAEIFNNLSSTTVIWHAPWLKADAILIMSNKYSGIPLIGLHGCIMYYPYLVLRQYNFLQRIPNITPDEDFIIKNRSYDEYVSQVHKALQAWRCVVQIRRTERIPCHNETAVGYNHWFLERGDAPARASPSESSSFSIKQLQDWEKESRAQAAKIKSLEKDVAAADHAMLRIATRDRIIQQLEQQLKIGEEKYQDKVERETYLESQIEEWKYRYEGKKRKQSEQRSEREELMETLAQLREQLREKQLEVLEKDAALRVERRNLTDQLNEARRREMECRGDNERLARAYLDIKKKMEENQKALDNIKSIYRPTYLLMQSIKRQFKLALDDPIRPLPPSIYEIADEFHQLVQLINDNL